MSSRVHLVDVNGCRHCGALARGHANRWIARVGWHTYAEPTTEERLARFKLKRGIV